MKEDEKLMIDHEFIAKGRESTSLVPCTKDIDCNLTNLEDHLQVSSDLNK